jgi:hypothetical protein
MDIGLAADRGGVAERFGDRLNDGLDADPRVLALLEQLVQRDRARAPGAEMLGGEVAARRRADVIVDVARADRLRLAVAVDVLEQHLARQLLAAADDALEVGSGDRRFMDDAVLADETHQQFVALAAKVPAPERGRAEALVVARIFLVADADVLDIEQANDRSKDGVAAELAALQILLDPAAQPRQRLAELAQPGKLGAVLLFAEVGMITILLAAPGIDPGRLEVAVRIGAKPSVAIGRRQADRVQPVDLLAIGDAFPVRIEIGPVSADALSADSGLGIAAVPQHASFRFTPLIEAHKRPATEGGSGAENFRLENPDRRHRRFRGIRAVRSAREAAGAGRGRGARVARHRSDPGHGP